MCDAIGDEKMRPRRIRHRQIGAKTAFLAQDSVDWLRTRFFSPIKSAV
jgi:hypothetical protein